MGHVVKKLVTLLGVALLVLFVGLIIIGQKNIGYVGIAQMMAGLAGILALLFVYNKQHK